MEDRSSPPARHVDVLWRGFHSRERLIYHPAIWVSSTECEQDERFRGCVFQLPNQRIRTTAREEDQRESRDRSERRPSRSTSRLAMDSKEHPPLWRRQEQCHHLG